MEKIPFRPLSEILEIVQQTGFDISYAYDDLLFSDHNVFIIRFDETNEKRLWLHFNHECEPAASKSIYKKLKELALAMELELINGSLFSVEQVEGKEEIELKFF